MKAAATTATATPLPRTFSWGDVTRRERALLRAMLDLDEVMSATGADTPEDRAWYEWAEQAHTHVRAWLVGRGFPV